jgi:hypothetical protein
LFKTTLIFFLGAGLKHQVHNICHIVVCQEIFERRLEFLLIYEFIAQEILFNDLACSCKRNTGNLSTKATIIYNPHGY